MINTQDRVQYIGMLQQNSTLPVHLGLILDGNRRWAKSRGLPALEGHRQGYQTLKTIAKIAIKQGIKYVSAFVFSTENWKRSTEEVKYLMNFMVWVSKNEVEELNKEGIKIRFVGSKDKVPKRVLSAMQKAETKTKNNTNGEVILCFNYGGRQEIADACTKIIRNNPQITNVTPDMIEQNLYSSDVPPIDLVIRTSGEQRLSNFMLWQSAYSELLFVDEYWPDFNQESLKDALAEYTRRQRRFGK